MAICSAITQSGDRCKRIALDSSEWCHSHHPGRADARSAYARKGGRRAGRGRPLAEVGDLRQQLAALYNGVLAGETETRVGAVLNQILNTRVRLVETELRVKEQQELEERVEQLEAQAERRGDSLWG